ncbi:MAG: MBL fold metallo-hydrolase [Candidatus Sumerlaeaceae bacterium]
MNSSNDLMRVTVLGSGTSAGVPTLGCRCAVCRSTNPRNKRMRSCAYIEYCNSRFLIDCGTDFRTQALAYGVEDVDFVLITHTHTDHVGGLDDLRAFNMVHGHAIDLYATPESLAEIRRRFSYCFQPPPPGGGIPEFNVHEIQGDFEVRGIPVRPVRVFHGKMPIIGFRLERFAWLTDVSSIPESSFELLRGVKILVTSALRHRPHPTHMSLREAVAVAQRVGAEQTYFIHMCHDLEHEATNALLPPNIQLAYDGLTFTV